MNLAILFWFHKDVPICINRLRLLRRYNPDVPVFALYGGERADIETFKAQLAPYIDDFFHFSQEKSAEWKWWNGDLMITDWYSKRGQTLPWDTIVVVQWDMLVFDSVHKIFAGLTDGQMLLSSLRPVKEVESHWPFTTKYREEYDEFINHIQSELNYSGPALCCNFVVACLPRRFFESYVRVKNPGPGFIEYRVPTYAEMFGIPFYKSKRFDCLWVDEPGAGSVSRWKRVLTTSALYIPFLTIIYHLLRKDGSRIFHPVEIPFPINLRSTRAFLFKVLQSSTHRNRRRFKNQFNRLLTGLRLVSRRK
jgi:KaiC/GvpD/RAD55 family RecA-like ATPase